MPILNRIFSRRTLAYVTGSTALLTGGGYWYLNSGPAYPASTRETRRAPPPWTPPSREEMLASLERSGKVKRIGSGSIAEKGKDGKEEDDEDIFDLLIVGGGATGAGVAVDAASRGLKVALVERDDFSAGTSSKSTKLVHGGVRYLQKAVFELDYDQYKLVKEALHERKIFLHTAPYLSSMLPIMLPIYKYWQIPYYYAGCKMYDVLAGKENMETSYLMSKGKAIEAFPMIKQDGLVGALVYYDGQHNDSRMNIALILTAVKLGAVAANYVEVTDLKKDENGKVNGARVKDTLSGKEWDVRARGVINATGPFSDTLLSLDSPSHIPIVQPSAGIHITLPNYYSPRKMGLLDPATSDGRVIFFLPWQGNTIAGTTDTKAEVEREPRAQEEEIRWVLEEVRRYLSPDIKVRRGDVLSAWSGLRPLVRNPNSSGTEGLVRSHIVHVSESGLLTIAGGKWTTYREMAEEAVDKAVESFGLRGRCKTEGGKCVTENLRLVGSEGWSRNLFIGLVQRYGIETEVAKHLSENYGDRSWTVLSLSSPTGLSWPLHGIRLVPSYPFIEAEVRYAVRHEYAQTAIDVLARRTRLSFLNVQAAMDALPRVVDIMAEEKGWSWGRKEREVRECVRWLKTMGLGEVGEEGVPRVIPRGVWEGTLAWGKYSLLNSVLHPLTWVKGGNVGRGAEGVGKGMTIPGAASRARFERGELAALTAAFDKHAHTVTSKEAGRDGEVEEVVDVAGLKDIVRCSGVKGYEEVSEKEWRYVLEEAGVLGERSGVDYDTFIEICGNLKEVAFAPEVMSKTQKAERKRIPVEKSGGGV